MNVLLQTIKTPLFVLLCGMVISVSFAEAQTQSPPDGNTAPPINVSTTTQIKAGSLGIGGSASIGAGLKLGFTSATCDALTEGSIIYEGGTLKICSDTEALTTGTSSELWSQSGSNIYYDLGNVAIGVDTPASGLALTVSGSMGADQFCDSNGANCVFQTDIGRSEWTKDVSDLYYTLGNVGIGTTNPNSLLHVQTNTAGDVVPVIIRNTNTGTNATGLEIGNGPSRSVIESERSTGSGADIVFNTSGSAGSLNERMRILFNGNIGVGDTTPDALFDVEGDLAAVRYCDENGLNCVDANNLGDSLWAQSGSAIYYNAGNVGASVSNPLQSLHAGGNIQTDGRRIYFGSNQVLYGTGSELWYLTNNSSDPAGLVLQSDTGNILTTLYGSGTDGNEVVGLLDSDSEWIMYSVQDSRVGFRVNNNEIMTLLHDLGAPSVGIATTTIDTGLTLDVAGNIGADQYCNEDGTTCISADNMGQLWTQSGSDIYYDTGHVGIGAGATTPTQALTVDGNIAMLSGRNLYLGSQTFYGDNASEFRLVANNANTNRLALQDNASNVLGELYGTDAGGTDLFGLLDGDSQWAVQVQNNNNINFRVNNIEQARVLSGGLAVGGTALSGGLTLDVTGNVGATQYCDENGLNCAAITDLGGYWTQSGTDLYYTGGDVGIGDPTPDGTLALDLGGQIGATEYCDENGLNCYSITALAGAGADNLGNHTATQNIILGTNYISSAGGNAGIRTNASGDALITQDVVIGDGRYLGFGDESTRIVGDSVSDVITFLTNGGLERMRINASGDVGIGDISPAQKLEVGGNISMSAGRHVYFGSQDLYGDGVSAMYFDSNHSTAAQFALRDLENDYYGALYGTQGDSFGLLDGDGNWGMQIVKDSNINWRINNTEEMRLTSTGLGLGDAAPASRLQVGSDTVVDSTNYITFGDRVIATQTNPPFIGQDSIDGTENGLGLGSRSNDGGINFYTGGTGTPFTAGTRRMRLDAAGNLGIGDDVPDGTLKLDVEGQVGATEYCDENGANCVTAGSLGTQWTTSGSDIYYNTGDVTIGATTPSGTLMLDVDGQIGGTEFCDEAGNNCFDPASVAFASSTLGGGGTTNYLLKFANATTVADSIIYDNGTNVGISDPTPNQKLDVAGNISMSAGRHMYLGSQDLYGDDNTALYFDSNNTVASRIILRDSDNDNFGSLYGTQGDNIGLLDGDSQWAILHTKDSHTSWRINSVEQMRLTTTGLGLGVTDPNAELEVNGLITGGFGAQTTAGTTDWNHISNARSGNGYTLLQGSATNGPDGTGVYYHPFSFEYTNKDGTGNMTQLAIPYNGNTPHLRYRFGGVWSNWFSFVTDDGTGDVGIGDTTPDGTLKLDVEGQIGATEYCDQNGANCLAVTAMGADNLGNHLATAGIGRNAHNTGHLVGSYNNIGPNGAQSNPIYTIGSNYNPALTTLGNMYGIGYANGGQASFLTGTAAGWGMYVASGGEARTFLSAGISNSYINKDGGNVGIGTDSPVYQLDVAGAIRTTDTMRFGASGNQRLYGDDSSALYYTSNNGNISQIVLRDSDSDTYGHLYGSQGDYFGLLDGDGHWAYQHQKDVQSSWRINNSEQMRLTTTGLAIGHTNPSSSLHPYRATNGLVSQFESAGGGDNHSLYVYLNEAANFGSEDNLVTLKSSGTNAGSLALGSGNSEVMRVTTGLDVGIGDTTPDGTLKLDVEGQIGATEYCDQNGANCLSITNMGNDNLGNHTATQDIFTYNYGTGVTGVYSPTRYQHVWGMGSAYNLPADGLDETGPAGNFYGLAWSYNPDHSYAGSNPQAKAGLNHQLLLMMNGTTNTAIGNGMWTTGDLTFDGPQHIYFGNQDLYGDNSTALYFDSNNSSASRIILRDAENDQYGSLYGSQGDNIGLLDGDSHWAYQHEKDVQHNWKINNTEQMRLTTQGLALGTTGTAGYRLYVNGQTYTNNTLDLNYSSPTIRLRDTDHYSGFIHQNSNLFYILSGSGVNSGSYTVNANGRWPMNINMINNNAVFGGDINAISFTQASDINLKKDVRTLSGLDLVMNLRGVEFKWKESGEKSYGLIAQEVEQILPELVTETEITDPETGEVTRTEKAVQYANLVAPLIEATKEQQSIIESQQRQIDELTKRLDHLEKTQ